MDSGGSLKYLLAKQLCGVPVDAGPLQGLADLQIRSVDPAFVLVLLCKYRRRVGLPGNLSIS